MTLPSRRVFTQQLSLPFASHERAVVRPPHGSGAAVPSHELPHWVEKIATRPRPQPGGTVPEPGFPAMNPAPSGDGRRSEFGGP